VAVADSAAEVPVEEASAAVEAVVAVSAAVSVAVAEAEALVAADCSAVETGTPAIAVPEWAPSGSVAADLEEGDTHRVAEAAALWAAAAFSPY